MTQTDMKRLAEAERQPDFVMRRVSRDDILAEAIRGLRADLEKIKEANGAADALAAALRAEKAEALLREAREACFRDALMTDKQPEREERFGLVARIDAHLAGEPGQGDDARAALTKGADHD